jgi:NCAIR mutase (PurE)-related protein
MDPARLRDLLVRVQSGDGSIDEAMEALRALPFGTTEHATVDHHRALRQGLPEVVFGQGKSSAQIIAIAREIAAAGHNVLVTRVHETAAAEISRELEHFVYHPVARVGTWEVAPIPAREVRPVAIVTAGTSDVPVAEEAAETLRMGGIPVVRHFDVGVAGLHRILSRVEELQRASAVIVIAGMEGALPSVVGGLVAAPVVAVPTSVGYGTALGGFTALFSMLTSCASGVAVVNIDSGFGAAMAVFRILVDRGR